MHQPRLKLSRSNVNAATRIVITNAAMSANNHQTAAGKTPVRTVTMNVSHGTTTATTIPVTTTLNATMLVSVKNHVITLHKTIATQATITVVSVRSVKNALLVMNVPSAMSARLVNCVQHVIRQNRVMRVAIKLKIQLMKRSRVRLVNSVITIRAMSVRYARSVKSARHIHSPLLIQKQSYTM